MRISAQIGLVISVIFTLVCLGVAVTGFTSLDGIPDPVQKSDARGFAWFYTFLAAVGVVFGVLTWWAMRWGEREGD